MILVITFPFSCPSGQAVERRGRDIGALFNRKILDPGKIYRQAGYFAFTDKLPSIAILCLSP